MSHGKVVCGACGRTAAQCRCPNHAEVTYVSGCQQCQANVASPATSSPPVQEPPLLTFAEAWPHFEAGKDMEYRFTNEGDDRWLSVKKETPFSLNNLSRTVFRVKPAPAMGRCREMARTFVATHANPAGQEAFGDFGERVAKEVLDDVVRLQLDPGMPKRLRLKYLGYGVPAQDQDR